MHKIGATVAAVAAGSVLVLSGCDTGGGTTLATVRPHTSVAPLPSVPESTSPTAVSPSAAAPRTQDSTVATEPAASFGGDGTYVVGSDIAPGTYKSSGGPRCYWARLGDLSGNEILANDISAGPSVVTVLPSDAALKVSGCARWTLAPASARPPVSGGSSGDDAYRGMLRSGGVFFPSDSAALDEGHVACSLYSGGRTNSEVAQQIVADYPDLGKAEALTVERAATVAYCPEFS